jgi:hypothetical protein
MIKYDPLVGKYYSKMIDEAVACVNNLQWDKTILLYYAFSPVVAYYNLPKLYNN